MAPPAAHRATALAILSRSRDLAASRDDERRRKQDSRARRKPQEQPRVTGPSVTPCHAPPSAPNPLQFPLKVLEIWDRESARSRATLERILTEFPGTSGASSGTRGVLGAPVSRASLFHKVP